MGALRVQVWQSSILGLCRMESLESVSFHLQLQQQVESQLDLMLRLKSLMADRSESSLFDK